LPTIIAFKDAQGTHVPLIVSGSKNPTLQVAVKHPPNKVQEVQDPTPTAT